MRRTARAGSKLSLLMQVPTVLQARTFNGRLHHTLKRNFIAVAEKDVANFGRTVGLHLASNYSLSKKLNCSLDVVGDHSLPFYSNCILLSGDPGAGKTVFARGLISSLTNSNDVETIPSPSFCLDFDYPIDKESHPGLASAFPRSIHHLDLYRLPNANRSDLQSLDFFNIIKDAVTLVEWPDRLDHAGVTLPGALLVDIKVQAHKDEEKDKQICVEMLSESTMESWISQPRSINLTYPYRSSLWSQFIENAESVS